MSYPLGSVPYWLDFLFGCSSFADSILISEVLSYVRVFDCFFFGQALVVYSEFAFKHVRWKKISKREKKEIWMTKIS